MSERSSIFRNTLVSYASFGITALVGFALVPFLIRTLGEESYGVLGVVSAVLEIAVLVDLGTRQAAARQFTHFLAQKDLERANQLASTALALYLVIAFVLTLILAAIGPGLLGLLNVPPHLASESYAVLLVAGLTVSALLVRAPYDAALAAQMRHDLSHYADLLSILARAAIVVSVFLLWRPHLVIWPLASLVATLFGIALVRWQAHRHSSGFRITPHRVSMHSLRDIAGFSGYTSVLRLTDWMSASGTPLILSFFLGPGAVAHYAPAVAIVAMLQPLARSFLNQLVPVVTRAHVGGEQRRIERAFLEGARYGLLTTGAAAALIASVAAPLIRFWLGPGFEDTATVLLLLCAGEIAQASVGAAFPIWVGIGKLGVPAAIGAASGIIGLVVTAFLTRSTGLGVSAAAIGIVTAQMLRVICEWKRATSILGVPIGDYVGESLIGPSIALAAGAGTSLFLQNLLALNPFLELAVGAGGGVLMLGSLAWSIGLRPEDRQRLLGHARSELGKGWLGR